MYPKFFATTNENKVREVNEFFDSAIEQVSIKLLEPQDIQVKEVVSEKAKDAFLQVGEPVLVEDTGLAFGVWNGLPGALISWFLETVGNEGILKMFAGETDRAAVAQTAVGFFDGEKVHIFIGAVSGTISETVRGGGGFGWDAIFIPNGHGKSFAEMEPGEKNTVSMRTIALERMKAALQQKT